MLELRNITIDCADPQALAPFWRAATGYEEAFANEWFVDLVLPGGAGPHICLAKVPEERAGKNRVHMDFMVDDRPAEVARLVALGAREGPTHDAYGINWTVMHDPEGNEFCVATRHA